MGMSETLRNELLDALGNASAYSVATPYVSLHTGDPGTNGASEVSGGSYARQSASFGALNAGNFLWGGALTAPKTTTAGDTLQIAIGDLDVTLT